MALALIFPQGPFIQGPPKPKGTDLGVQGTDAWSKDFAGLGFTRVWGFGFRVRALGFTGFRVRLEFRLQGLGGRIAELRVVSKGLSFRVEG